MVQNQQQQSLKPVQQAYQSYSSFMDVTFGHELPREMNLLLSPSFSDLNENKETCAEATDQTLPLSGQCYLKDKSMNFKKYIISIEDCATVVLSRPHSSK